MPICLLSLSLLLTSRLCAQRVFPFSEGERVRYTAVVQMPDACLSGICVLLNDSGVVRGCLFNEFGITLLDFSYRPERQKVKLHHVLRMIDRWYVRRVLRKDLALLMRALQGGANCYTNERRNISYRFVPIKDEETEPTKKNE